LGGVCALYYGLAHNFDIISGSAGTYHIPGGSNNRWNFFPNAIKAAQGKYDGRIYITYGAGESRYRNVGMAFMRDLDAAGIAYEFELFDFSNHQALYHIFPNILTGALSRFLYGDGKTAVNLGIVENFFEKKAFDLADLYKNSVEDLNSIELSSIMANADIKERFSYAENNMICEKHAEYALQNHWFVAKHPDSLFFPNTKQLLRWAVKNDPAVFSLRILANLMRFFAHTKNRDVWNVVECFMADFLNLSRNAFVKNLPKDYWNTVRSRARIVAFIEYYCLVRENGLDRETGRDAAIHAEILSAYGNLLKFEKAGTGYRESLEIDTVLLLIAQYFRNDPNAFDKIYSTALTRINATMDYVSNKGCVLTNWDDQYWFADRYKFIFKFLNANAFPETEAFRIFLELADAIVGVANHSVIPNLFSMPLGRATSKKRNAVYIPESYISTENNIAFLKNERAFISINSGPEFLQARRQQDQLSFTFFYDGYFMLIDGGTTNSKDVNVIEYFLSGSAHSTLLAEDAAYIPIALKTEYSCIISVEEFENHTIVRMENNQYEDCMLSRMLIWIKPNVIVLIDEAKSRDPHMFAQNFMLAEFAGIDDSDAAQFVAYKKNKAAELRIVQFGDGKYERSHYSGRAKFEERIKSNELRGTVSLDGTSPKAYRNLVYRSQCSDATFATVIEAHTGKDDELCVTIEKFDTGWRVMAGGKTLLVL
jgi:hypothetical protein